MVVQNFSINDVTPTAGGAVESVNILQAFNPGLGTSGWAELTTVDISLTATVNATIQVENTDLLTLGPVLFTFQYRPTADLAINGGATLLTGINPQATDTFVAGPPDGVVDFAGTSGTTTMLSAMDSGFLTIPDGGTGFASFDSNGVVQLDVTTFLQNLASIPTVLTDPVGKPYAVGLDIHDVDFSGTITYSYAPEPASMFLMGTVFGLAWLFRRCRRG